MTDTRPTIWVLGDQLRRTAGVLAEHTPDTCRVLLVESDSILGRHRWHRQRAHMVISAMRHFAAELEAEVMWDGGFWPPLKHYRYSITWSNGQLF